jgi:hypothetical protein
MCPYYESNLTSSTKVLSKFNICGCNYAKALKIHGAGYFIISHKQRLNFSGFGVGMRKGDHYPVGEQS